MLKIPKYVFCQKALNLYNQLYKILPMTFALQEVYNLYIKAYKFLNYVKFKHNYGFEIYRPTDDYFLKYIYIFHSYLQRSTNYFNCTYFSLQF